MLHDFSRHFSKYKDPSYVNLNNGTLGLCPDVVIDYQKTLLERYELNTSNALGGSWKKMWSLHERLAQFISAKPQDLFLRPNVTLALNEIIMGLNLPARSEILTCDFEYGAVVNILRHKASKDDLDLRIEDFSFVYDVGSSEEFVIEVLKRLKPQTKVFVLSHIFTGNGLIAPIKELSQALRSRDVLFVVDGAHAPGLIDINAGLDWQDLDFYAGNLHKWFMGPKGTAFGWVHPRLQGQLQPQYGSWTTFKEAPSVMSDFGNQDDFVSRFLWSHSQSFSAYFALDSAFDFWNQLEPQKIYNEIAKRMEFLKSELSNVKSVGSKGLPSAFLSYSLSAFSSIELEGLFIKNTRLQVGLPRLPGKPLLRLTPHIHNSERELEKAVEILKSCVV